MALPGSTLPAEYDRTALVPGPGGGLMIGDVNPDAVAPTFAPNPMGGPPIMVPAAAPPMPNLPPIPGSQPTGTGPIPGIASTQFDPAPRSLPALGPNAAPPPPGAAPPPGAPGAAPGAPGGLPVAAPGAAPRPARGGGGGPGARPAAGPDALQQDITKIGQAEEAGIQKTQEAKTEAADRLAQATGDLSVQQRMDAQELQDRQETYRAAQVHMEEQERGALQKARDYTIPDFWEGREGARVGSVISIAMGNIASSITGGANGAMTIINKNVDDYFHRQKEKVDNLYKYAEQTGRLNERTRMRYAQELTGLQAQHLAVQQAVITRIESVKAANQGMVDTAQTDELLAKAKADQAKRVQDYRTNQAHLSLMGAQTQAAKASAAHSYAAAAAAKAGAGDIKSQKLQLEITGQLERTLKGDKQYQSLSMQQEELAKTKAALESGNPLQYGAALDSFTKSATGLGARPGSVQLFESRLGGTMEQIRSHIEHAATGNKFTPDMLKRFQGAVASEMKENARAMGEKRTRYEGSFGAHPVYKQNPEIVKAILNEKFGEPQVGPAAPALPPGLPPGSEPAGRTKDGRNAYRLPNGTLVAG